MRDSEQEIPPYTLQGDRKKSMFCLFSQTLRPDYCSEQPRDVAENSPWMILQHILAVGKQMKYNSLVLMTFSSGASSNQVIPDLSGSHDLNPACEVKNGRVASEVIYGPSYYDLVQITLP
jgi:hypothetical protein